MNLYEERTMKTTWKLKWKEEQKLGPRSTIGEPVSHRRRTKTKEKAKVVTAAWRAELIQCLAVLATLHQDNVKNRMNCSRTMWRIGLIHPFLQNSKSGKELNQSIPAPKQQWQPLCLLFCLFPSSMPFLQSCDFFVFLLQHPFQHLNIHSSKC